jgi:hypothetical protein
MKKFWLLLFYFPVFAQTDSTKVLEEVKVYVFEKKRSTLNTPDAFIHNTLVDLALPSLFPH